MIKLQTVIFCGWIAVGAQAGTLKGTVLDKKTKEPLIGASIQVDGTSVGAVTDMDGHYTLSNLADKKYNFKIRYISYDNLTIEQLPVDGETVQNFEMEPTALALADVSVVALRNQENENILLLEQKNAVLAVQRIGSKELGRKGIGDAEGAVAKIAGISKQEGIKNVFVRGLGDRYNQTTLNGFPIPSEDPEYKNISLHFFGTDMIQSVDVDKVFSAGKNANVSGANINISSKSLMQRYALNMDINGGINTYTALSDFYKIDGVNKFGFANNKQPSGNLAEYDFVNRLNPIINNAQINQSYGVKGGYNWTLKKNSQLSFFVVANYEKNYSKTSETTRNATADGIIYQDQTGDKNTENTYHLLLGNINADLTHKHKLTYNFLFIHSNKQYLGRYDGYDADYNAGDGGFGIFIRQQTNDNTLMTHQLLSEWTLIDNLTLSVAGNCNLVKGIEPDRRTNTISEYTDDNSYRFMKGDGVQQRYFSELKEKDWNGKVALKYTWGKQTKSMSYVQIGYNFRQVQDIFKAILYNQNILYGKPKANPDNIDLDAVFNQSGLDNNVFAFGKNIDRYEVYKTTHEAYAELMYEINKQWSVNAGIRMDDIKQNLYYALNNDGNKGNRAIDKTYWLPSTNIRYLISPEHTIRMSFSKTYILPQAKEIAPFRYYDVNFSSEGNKDLQPSHSYNADVKYEWFMTPTELLSTTLFLKHITDPIARTDQANAAGVLTYMNVSDKASVAGIEMELRKNIFVLPYKEGQNKLSFGLNGSYIYTHCKINVNGTTEHTGSQLEGASPWIVNADLSYHIGNGKSSFSNTLVFNYFSDRVYVTGMQGFYDTIEKGVPTLDFVSSAQINKHWTMKLKAINLLNSTYQLTRQSVSNETTILKSYKKGINISIEVSYNL